MNPIDTVAHALTALQDRIYAALRKVQARALMVIWAIDHLVLAVCTLGQCKPYEMISSALWALDCRGKFFGKLLRPVIDFLLRPLGPNHCRNSYIWQINLYEGVKK